MTTSQETGQVERPGRSRSRRSERIKLIAISAAINGLILVGILLVVLPRKSPPPPKVIVAIREAPREPDDLENQTVQKLKRFLDSDNAAAGMVLPITATSSPITLEVPDFAADLGDMPGLLSGFGDGDGNGSEGRGGDGFTADIGGMNVRAIKLGVVIDVSGSMKEELPAVRRELFSRFRNAAHVEVVGCNLRWKGPVEFDPGAIRKRFDRQFNAPSTLRAIELLIVHKKVDAIYWFADLQDQQDEEGLRRLVHLLGLNPGGARRPVRFYIHSVEHDPGDGLRKIVKRSGGDFRSPQTEKKHSTLSSRSASDLGF